MTIRNNRLWGLLWVLPFKMLRNCGWFWAIRVGFRLH